VLLALLPGPPRDAAMTDRKTPGLGL